MALLQKLGASSRLLRSSPSHLTLSRSFAADAHGSAKVPMWTDPMSPSKWKEEHFVFVSLAGWGSLFYGGYKFFSSRSSKKDLLRVNRAQKARRGLMLKSIEGRRLE